VRWVGNEHGVAGDPCWATINSAGLYPGFADPAVLNSGQRAGTSWLPAECDVSIRPGWFYHAHEDDKVRTPANLMELYFASVGRGANLLVNLPVAPTGQVHPLDRAALLGFAALRRAAMAHSLCRAAAVTTSSVHASLAATASQLLCDGRSDTFWAAADDDKTPTVTVRFDRPQAIGIIAVGEYLPLGQRIESWDIAVERAGNWEVIAMGQSIGNRRLVDAGGALAGAVRLRITQSAATPVLQLIEVYAAGTA
jgi:alpha-L-fucosidase